MNKQDAKYDRWIETRDGRLVGYILHGLTFRSKVEIGKEIRIINPNDTLFYKDSNLPTVDELVECGVLLKKTTYEEYTVNCGKSPILDKIDSICDDFKKHGLDITPEHIWLCYRQYIKGNSGGFRDEIKGYHLFMPHDENLIIMATTLSPQSSDWQATYTY